MPEKFLSDARALVFPPDSSNLLRIALLRETLL
jgi:hypothetical protein